MKWLEGTGRRIYLAGEFIRDFTQERLLEFGRAGAKQGFMKQAFAAARTHDGGDGWQRGNV